MKKPTEVIIIHERAGTSWRRDMSSVVAFVALIGIGVLLESSAMQWIGAVFGFVTILANVRRILNDNRMTTDQARKRLDEIDREASL